MSGNTKVKADHGVYTFEGIAFIAQPNYKSNLKFTSTAINENGNQLYLESSEPSPSDQEENATTSSNDTFVINSKGFISTLALPVNFRDCISGEII